jgi:Fe-S cluster assembly ATP-binding protein
MALKIQGLKSEIGGKEILKGVNLELEKGKIYALMGPNGSGKSTLANIIMGNPQYKVTSGRIILNQQEITNLAPDKRAKEGIFMSFQNPKEIQGVTIANLIKRAYNELNPKKTLFDAKDKLNSSLKDLHLEKSFSERYVNEGFSGGEKKKSEILQLLSLDPKIVILDETDSGLDIDALRTVAQGVNKFFSREKTVLIISHYKRIFNFIKPDKVIIMINGKIALEGNTDLIDHLEEKGYGWITEENSG